MTDERDEKKKASRVPAEPTAEEKENAKKLGDGVPRSYAGDGEEGPDRTSFGSTGPGGTGGG